MPTFKRNQVEEAISRAIDPTAEKPSTDLLNRLKRLLDTDRSLGRSAKSVEPEKDTYAFFSQDAAGSGIEIRFQEYEAFTLLIGWRFLEHGFPQQKAVLALRRMRRPLEQEHARIMQLESENPVRPATDQRCRSTRATISEQPSSRFPGHLFK